MNDIKLDGDAAVVGGVHSDSHDTHTTYQNTTNSNTVNNTTNTVNNTTVHEAMKSREEVFLDNENQFMQTVEQYVSNDGRLDQLEYANLSQLAVRLRIAPQRATQIIDIVRRKYSIAMAGKGTEQILGQMLQDIFDAIQANRQDVLRHKYHVFEQLARSSADSNAQFYYHLLQASFFPENSTVAFINSRTDNYWQLFWVYVAYVKLGNIDSATVLLPRLGAFGCPQGDVFLLMAISNIAEWRKKRQDYYLDDAKRYLQQAADGGLSDALSPLWYAAGEMVKDKPKPEDWYQFYCEVTLKELGPVRAPELPKMSKGMTAPPPPLPKFNAQNVQLNQMGGFNALKAANSMGLGSIPQYNPNQAMTPTQMPGQPVMAPPPMPGQPAMSQPTPPTMPQAPTASPAPSAPFASKSVQPPTMPGAQAKDEFFIDDGEDEDEWDEDEQGENELITTKYGIILTNTDILARKYGCEQAHVMQILSSFVEQAAEQDMEWHLVDMAQLLGRGVEADTADWTEYSNAVSEQIQIDGLPTGSDLHLFIIGGDDVIPVPRVKDPWEHGEGEIPTDMPYCFEGNFIPAFIEGTIADLQAADARNNVARLPLEDGRLDTDIESDLVAYFNISGMYADGIPVASVVMESNSSWIPASTTMTEHLPLLYSDDDPELIQNRMYISPKLTTSDEQSMNIYRQSIAKTDMLMFNLHGGDQPEDVSFFNDEGEAFAPAELYDSSARVLNTVACFGARYLGGYKRHQSMLLQALYGGGILLYTGSLVSVPMYIDRNEDNDLARQMLLNPGTGSEVFMRLYALYQFRGMTAGKALLQAKCDYFNMCRHVESDTFSLSTALMFGLYGNPMLYVKEQEAVIEAALTNNAVPAATVKSAHQPIRKAVVKTILTQEQLQGSKSLLEEAREAVDNNLQLICNQMAEHLYQQLGLPPRQLREVSEVSRPHGAGVDTSYCFTYHNPDAHYDADHFVEVDEAGKVKRVYSTK